MACLEQPAAVSSLEGRFCVLPAWRHCWHPRVVVPDIQAHFSAVPPSIWNQKSDREQPFAQRTAWREKNPIVPATTLEACAAARPSMVCWRLCCSRRCLCFSLQVVFTNARETLPHSLPSHNQPPRSPPLVTGEAREPDERSPLYSVLIVCWF
jgi:hypothetical protein